MKMFIGIDDTGRILASTDVEEYAIGMTEFEFPDDFDFSKQDDYRIIDGVLTSDPRPIPAEQQISELKQKLAATDYIVAKIAESQITGVSLQSEDAERYADIITQRQQWRQKINELESEAIQNG